MTRTQKRTAALLIAALMTTGTAEHFPELSRGKAATDTVLTFVRQLEAAGQLSTDKNSFAELRYSDEEQQLYQDGTAVGRDCQGFRIIGGELMVDAAMTLTAAEQAAAASDAEGYIPIAEAKDRIGLDIYENNGNTVIAAPFQTGTLIVKSDAAVDPHGAVQITEGYDDLHVLQYETAADAYTAYQAFAADDSIVFAEPNRIVHAAETAAGNITYRGDGYWGRDAIGADAYLEQLNRRVAPGNEIKVAIIDTGIYSEHEWFEDRIAEGGASFVAENNGSYEDLHTHGTHCAGIVCSVTNDNVKILPIKALDAYGSGSNLGIYLGMIYAAEQGADVVSMSLGGLGISPLMCEGARVLREADIPTIVAAGNESMDVRYSTPANIDSVISVSSVTQPSDSDEDYTLSWFSNYGAGIDFAAPGEEIRSAGIIEPDWTLIQSGTSMATPYVAGCVADLLDFDNSLTTDEIYALLRDHATDLGEEGFDHSFGWGMVNLGNFALEHEGVAQPEASLPGDTYTGEFTVTLTTATSGAEIRYTLDGTVPTAENGILYDGTPITIQKTTELRAVAVLDGKCSLMLCENYLLSCAMPKVSLEPGTYTSAQTVRLSAATNARIYYSTDGTIPSAETGTLYRGEEIEILQTTVILAVAVAGELESDLMSAAYVIKNTGYDALFRIENGVLEAYYGNLSLISDDMFPQDQPLTEIGASVFAGNDDLKVISLPDSVTVIGDHAFDDCVWLKSFSAAGVTEIGDYAFYHCASFSAKALDMQIDWSNLTSIGEHAFESSAIYGDLNLSKLESLGAYAFSNTSQLYGDVTLPAQIAALPDGVFQNCKLTGLTAPGVTEIGAYALCTNNSTTPVLETLNLDFRAVTSIGMYALQAVDFTALGINDVSFDALTDAGRYAFVHVKAGSMSCPALRHVANRVFCEEDISVLYLEAVETIDTQAFSTAYGCRRSIIVVGDALRNVDQYAADPYYADDFIFAGPAESPLHGFALVNDWQYIVTPNIYVPETAFTVMPYETPVLHAYPLGFDVHTHWERIEADGTASMLETVPEYVLLPDTDTVGTYLYRAVMEQEGQPDVCSEMITVTVAEPEPIGEVTSSEWYGIIDWTALYPGDERYEQSVVYTFTPAHDGYYYIYASDNGTDVTVAAGTGRFEQPGYGGVLPDVAGIALAANETVQIVVQNRWEDCTCLYVTESIPELSLSYGKLLLPQDTCPINGGVEQPEVEVTINEYDDNWNLETITLTEGTDYVVRSVRTMGNYTINREAYVFGIGAYSGVLHTWLRAYTDYTLETAAPLTASKDNYIHIFRIQPETSDTYTLYLDFTDDDLAAAEAGDVSTLLRVDDWEYLTTIGLYDTSFQQLAQGEAEYGFGLSALNTLTYEMQAGETYYLIANVAAETELILQLRSEKADGIYNLMSVYSDLPDEIWFTEIPETWDFEVWDTEGNTLYEDIDYTVQFLQTVPGYLTVLMRGIGQYYGTAYRFIRLIPDFDWMPAELVLPDDAVTCTEEFALYAFHLDSDSEVLFRTLDDTARPFEAWLYGINYETWEWEIAAAYTEQSEPTELELSADFYYLLIQQPEAQSLSFMFETVSSHPALWNAEAQVDVMRWTGQPLEPVFELYYEGVLLKQGIDFIILPHDPIINCGMYYITLYGIGAYSGMQDIYLTVVPDTDTAELTLQEGINTVEIAQAGDSQLFKWNPTKADYCIWKSDTLNETVLVYDATGVILDFIEEPGYAGLTVHVNPRETYYVYAAYYANDRTGSFDLHVTSDFTELSDCTVDVPEQMLWQPDGNLPTIRILDGDTVLTEGVDYDILAHGGEQAPGHAQITLIGRGRYVGMLDFDYYLYLPIAELAELAWFDSYALSLNEPVSYTRSYPGSVHLFTFTAPETGSYYLHLPTVEYGGVAAFVFDQNEEILPMNTTYINLNAGESVQIACVTDWLESMYDISDDFDIMVSDYAPPIWYETDGYTYLIADGEAILIDIPYEMTGLTIPDVIFDETDGITAVFAGISDDIEWLIAQEYTIYGENGGVVDKYCHEWGLCFAGIDPDCTVWGDITGDGVLNDDDSRTLLRWLSECSGMRLSANAYTAADLDGDGIVTMMDLAAMMTEIRRQTEW